MTRLSSLLASALIALGLGAAPLGLISAADYMVEAEARAVEAGDEEEDSLHVSDETLATSLFIPFCFIGATLAVFIWAIRNRARRSEDEIPMPWWRTRQWYTRGTEEE